VELADLRKSFPSPGGDVEAVRGIDIAVGAGETVALLGPNGAGKSTTIDMVLGLLEPDSGSVSVFGMTPTEAVARGGVGATLQTGSLIRDLSVRELLALVASLYPSSLDVDETIEMTGITSIADRRTQKLSGGETQRARFAIALVSNPALLVLDEPTVAMDVESRRGFWAVMRDFAAKGRTVLFATHHLDEADAYAGRVVLMAKGKVVADGPPAQVKAMVGTRTIRAALPDVDSAQLEALPGVVAADSLGDTVTLHCSDSDAAIRAFLATYPTAHAIEIAGAGLEQAFLELTTDGDAVSEAQRAASMS
jgi:ABC-2 type transport system ATP-binding protein